MIIVVVGVEQEIRFPLLDGKLVPTDAKNAEERITKESALLNSA